MPSCCCWPLNPSAAVCRTSRRSVPRTKESRAAATFSLFLVLSPQLLAGVVRARSSLPPFLDDSNFSLSTTEHRSTSMSTIITELVDLVTFLAQPKVLMIQWFLVPAMVVLINVLQQLVCPAFIVHRAGHGLITRSTGRETSRSHLWCSITSRGWAALSAMGWTHTSSCLRVARRWACLDAFIGD